MKSLFEGVASAGVCSPPGAVWAPSRRRLAPLAENASLLRTKWQTEKIYTRSLHATHLYIVLSTLVDSVDDEGKALIH